MSEPTIRARLRRQRIHTGEIALCLWELGDRARAQREPAPVLVFVHGYGESGASWRDVCGHLRHRARMVAPDLRGHGHSGRPRDGDYSLAATVRDLTATQRRFGAGSLLLVGHSTGAMTALAHAATRPAGLIGLALLDCDPFRFKDGLERLLPFRGRRSPGRRADFVRDWLTAHPRDDAATAWRRLEPLLRRSPDGRWTWRLDSRLRPRRARAPQHATARTAVTRMLRRLEVPLLLVRGSRSAAVSRADLEAIALLAPGSATSIREIAGAGHALPADAPAKVAAEIDAFYSEIVRGRTARSAPVRPSRIARPAQRTSPR